MSTRCGKAPIPAEVFGFRGRYVDLRGFGPHNPVGPFDALGWMLSALGATAPADLTEQAALLRSLVSSAAAVTIRPTIASAARTTRAPFPRAA